MRDGLLRMYGDPADERNRGRDPNVMYYLTLYNEPYPQPAEPADLDVDGPAARALPVPRSPGRRNPTGGAAARLRRGGAVGAGRAGAAGPGLGGRRRGLVGDVLGRAAPRRRRVRPAQPAAPAGGAAGAAPAPGAVRGSSSEAADPGGRRLGLDARGPRPDPPVGAGAVHHAWAPTGSGFSDTRPAARRHFGVDAESITVAALAALAESGTVDRRVISEAAEKYQVADLP